MTLFLFLVYRLLVSSMYLHQTDHMKSFKICESMLLCKSWIQEFQNQRVSQILLYNIEIVPRCAGWRNQLPYWVLDMLWNFESTKEQYYRKLLLWFIESLLFFTCLHCHSVTSESFSDFFNFPKEVETPVTVWENLE